VLGANSVVRGDIPAHSVAVGAPARVVRDRSADHRADHRAEDRVDRPADGPADRGAAARPAAPPGAAPGNGAAQHRLDAVREV
jgi:hypothetical protein